MCPNKKQTINNSVFHLGERDCQLRAGVDEDLSARASKAITDYLPRDHKAFFALLPMVFVAAEDKQQNIWSSLLISDTNFITINDPQNFTINSQFLDLDPLANQLDTNSEIGLLGIEFETRRRNRVSATVIESTCSNITLKVKQCYGNCPKYIQRRKGQKSQISKPTESMYFDGFDEDMSQFISGVDSLFIASKYIDDDLRNNSGIDSSHRGGAPGFIQLIDDQTILIPDYMGNNFFNTIGNITKNPKVGIQFLDYENQHRVMLSGTAEIIWAEDQELPFAGVDRMIKFTLKHGYHLKNCLPYTWDFQGYSPFSRAYSKEGLDCKSHTF